MTLMTLNDKRPLCVLVVVMMLVIGGLTEARGSANAIQAPDQLEAAVERARPGQEILVAPGRYDWQVELRGRGQAGRPIVIRPAEPGSVVFTGKTQLALTGSHIELHGFQFDGNTIEQTAWGRGLVFFDGATHCRLTGSTFRDATGGGSAVWFQNRAADNRVDHCQFIAIEADGIGARIGDRALREGPVVRNRIDHNVFMDLPLVEAGNINAIQLGSRAFPYADLDTGTVIEDNTFLRCMGNAEIICIKTSGTVVRNNRFLHCRGEISLRHGRNNTIQDNLVVDCSSGVRIAGPHQTVTGNTIIEPRSWGIVMTYGTPDLEHPASYLPVHDSVIRGNTIINARTAGIEVGIWKDRAFHNKLWAEPRYNASVDMVTSVAPHNNVIEGNLIIGSGDNMIVVNDAPDNRIEGNVLIGSETDADATAAASAAGR